MKISISQAFKSFGSQVVFENMNFEIKDKEKIALIGRNGSGKTTLLNVLSNQEYLDQGNRHVANNLQIGFLEQISIDNPQQTIDQWVQTLFVEITDIEQQIKQLSQQAAQQEPVALKQLGDLMDRFEQLGGYHLETEINTLLTKFGFSIADRQRSIEELSGGERTRLAFVMVLAQKPDILLLDEPTNHLDISTIEWLEGYLKRYNAAVVVTSHDRLFLDRVCDTVVELENQQAYRFNGNYSMYIKDKEVRQSRQITAYSQQQKEIQRLQALIDKYRAKASKASFAKSKQKYLDRMDKVDQPDKDIRPFVARFVPKVKGGKQVLTLDHSVVGYDQPLFELSLNLKRGQRLAIIGPNGCGKSALLKSIVGNIDFLGGEMLWGHQIEVGYFQQDLQQFTGNLTVLDEVWNTYPDLTQTEVRTVLGNAQFKADDVFKKVDILSGGEKVRLLLAKLMLQQANFLVLDEPTNHLDIESKEALEKSLQEFSGTVLFVSHDRYFIQTVADGILRIDDQGQVKLELFDLEKAFDSSTTTKETEEKSINKHVIASQNRRRNQRELKQVLEQLKTAEEQIECLRELRFEPEYYHDYVKMEELNQQIDDVNNEIAHLIEKWEELEEILQDSSN